MTDDTLTDRNVPAARDPRSIAVRLAEPGGVFLSTDLIDAVNPPGDADGPLAGGDTPWAIGFADLVTDRTGQVLLGLSFDCELGRNREVADAVAKVIPAAASGTAAGGVRYVVRDRYFLKGGVEVPAGTGEAWRRAEALWHGPAAGFPDTRLEWAQLLYGHWCWIYRPPDAESPAGTVGLALNYLEEILRDHGLSLPPAVAGTGGGWPGLAGDERGEVE